MVPSPTATPAKNIGEAILSVMQRVGYVQKSKSPDLKYSYASERELIRALRPAMLEEGIIVSVYGIEDLREGTFLSKSGNTIQYARVLMQVCFEHVPSGTKQVVLSMNAGMDVADKALSKAMTAAYKYALRQTFLIETGDEKHDGSLAGELDENGNGTKKAKTTEERSFSVPDLGRAIALSKDKGWIAGDDQTDEGKVRYQVRAMLVASPLVPGFTDADYLTVFGLYKAYRDTGQRSAESWAETAKDYAKLQEGTNQDPASGPG